MAYAYSGLALACVLWLSSLSPPLPEPAAASDSSNSILRHDLFVQIDPGRHALMATDQFTIEPGQARTIQLSLAPTLQLDRLVLSPSQTSSNDVGRDLSFEVDHQSAAAQHITIPVSWPGKGPATMTAYYHGTINDPPKEPRHLRFVTPSETAGHIGPEGIYLSSAQ